MSKCKYELSKELISAIKKEVEEGWVDEKYSDVEAIIEAVNADDPDATMQISIIGQVNNLDEKEWKFFLERAVELGDETAIRQLADFYLIEDEDVYPYDYEKAIALFKQLADKGSAVGHYHMAWHYLNEDSTSANTEAGMQHLMAAGDANEGMAAFVADDFAALKEYELAIKYAKKAIYELDCQECEDCIYSEECEENECDEEGVMYCSYEFIAKMYRLLGDEENAKKYSQPKDEDSSK